MFNHSAMDASKSPEPPLTHPGAPLDSDRSKQPPLPAPPYKPYTGEPAATEPYTPYAENPATSKPPYEPYKGI